MVLSNFSLIYSVGLVGNWLVQKPPWMILTFSWGRGAILEVPDSVFPVLVELSGTSVSGLVLRLVSGPLLNSSDSR